MPDIKQIPPVKSGWQFFFLLFLGKIQLNNLWSSVAYRYKYLFRTLFLSPFTLKWLDKLSQFPLMNDYLICQPNLVSKAQRPYASFKMTQKERFNALFYHYQFLSNQPDKLTKAIYNFKTPFKISQLTVKNELTIKIAVHSNDRYSREGEMSFYFYDNNDEILSILTFSIIEYQNKSTLFIGGLQGANSDNAREKIQKSTKACYGLFPKRLLIESALAFADHFKLEQIIAVSNDTHIYNNWRYKKRLKQVHSDYDDFWLTLAAERNKQDLFVLPNQIPRKALEDIASKKRSEYRNRYVLLDQLSKDLSEVLSSLTSDA